VSDRLTAALADRYTIERELGAGGMATVYLAHDIRHNRKVALKVLKPELAAVVGASRFLREVEVTANLQHPHILPLFESGEADGFLYYVMPFVEGESLRQRLARGALPEAEATRLMHDVADALAYAHARGVVHRDIKPDNVIDGFWRCAGSERGRRSTGTHDGRHGGRHAGIHGAGTGPCGSRDRSSGGYLRAWGHGL
jgi:serine/threonine-protein kinase